MANHAWANIENNHPQFFVEFCKGVEASSQRFGELFYFEQYEESIKASLVWKNTVIAEQEFFYDNSRVEWQHRQGTIQWWFCETVAAKACRWAQKSLGSPVLIGDDGIEELITPDYDLKYPRLKDWEKSQCSPLLYKVSELFNRITPERSNIEEILDERLNSKKI